jgi:hypothetical protein
VKIKTVNQYICEFCGKKKYSASAMRKHEKHCTMNPDRHCRMCVAISGGQHNLDDLKKLIPNPIDPTYKNIAEINAGIKKVLEETEGCPMCVMAVLRQKKILIPLTDFDYKKELKSAWSIINEERSQCQGYDC